MNIFVFSDESGVLDKVHNNYFVFGGLVLLSSDEKDSASRMYLNAEKSIRQSENLSNDSEVKAAVISNKAKGKLFRSLNSYEKFGIVIDQRKLHDRMFSSKKTKQRYLDWAYKYSIKKKLESLIKEGTIVPEEVENIYFYVDEHTTATDGRYELKESLEQEFKYGTYNFERLTFYSPIFPKLKRLELCFCDSKSKPLIRAADIVANRLYYGANSHNIKQVRRPNFHITTHP